MTCCGHVFHAMGFTRALLGVSTENNHRVVYSHSKNEHSIYRTSAYNIERLGNGCAKRPAMSLWLQTPLKMSLVNGDIVVLAILLRR
jgi:hypothetical protein